MQQKKNKASVCHRSSKARHEEFSEGHEKRKDKKIKGKGQRGVKKSQNLLTKESKLWKEEQCYQEQGRSLLYDRRG